jgi:rhodanese-related sulfurtransferase
METEKEIQLVTPKVAKQRLTEALWIDVRTPAEFDEIHIDGCVLHPLGDLDAAEVRRMAEGKSACVVVCRSGRRAAEAARKLRGIPGLCVLDGGVTAWEDAGLEVARGRKAMSLERQVRIAAGLFVLAGVALSVFVNPWWIALSAFVGAGLVFAGITDTCGMGLILARMPWNRRAACSCRK